MISIDWTENALSDLDNIFEYISHDSEFYARKYIDNIVLSLDRLLDFPFSGKEVPEAERDDIQQIIFKSHRIIYQIEPKIISVLGVIHCSKDMSNEDNQPWK